MKRHAGFWVCLAAALLAGCHRGTGVGMIVASTGGSGPLSYEVEEQSRELAKAVKVRQATAQRVNGLWQAQVEIRSIARQAVRLEYRFTWRDAQGLDQPSLLAAWRDVAVAPGETITLQGIASAPTAAHYVLSIRFRE